MTTTDTETIVDVTLDRRAVNALRQADDVYAHLFEGEHYLTAVKRLTSADLERRPFDDDAKVKIPCLGHVSDYERIPRGDVDAAPREVEACFANIWHASGVWQIVKPGDRLRLCWSRGGHSSENTRDVGWVGDSLTIEVIRKNDIDGRRPLQFLAGTYVGPNNSARYCR